MYMYIHYCFSLLGLVCCRYLSDEDDGVSEVMIPFAVQYIGVLKVHACIYM